MQNPRIHFFPTILGIFLALLSVPLAQGQAKSSKAIEFLDPPAYAPVPKHPDDEHSIQENLKKSKNRKSQERSLREEPFQPKSPSWKQQLRKQIQDEHEDPRNRTYLLELSLTVPLTVTKGDKSGYGQNPAHGFHLYWRRGGSHSDGRSGLFVGWRMAAFSGTGFYRKEPGSFGLLYLGPSIGWGSLNRPYEDSGRSHPRSLSAEDTNRSGYLWALGLSAAHSQGNSETTPESERKNDFTSRRLAFDSPGLWAEGRFFYSYVRNLSVSPLIGFQWGTEKIIIYAGVGFGGWT